MSTKTLKKRTIPKCKKSFQSFLKGKNVGSFFPSPVTYAETEILIPKLNPSKSAGPFSLPVHLLQILKSSISHPLTALIIYDSFDKGIFPEKFKLARITPIHKKEPVTL